MGCTVTIPEEGGNPSSQKKSKCYEKILCSLTNPPKFVSPREMNKVLKSGTKLAETTTSTVYQIEYNGMICAVKVFPNNGDGKWNKKLFATEALILSKLKHHGIIKLVDLFYNHEFYYIVTEKADYDLSAIVRNPNYKKHYLPEEIIKNIIYSLLVTISYLHSFGIIHRDLKPENIVFTKTNEHQLVPQLIDFGDATVINKKDENKVYRDCIGTIPYMSPERLGIHTAKQLKKSDIWSIGVISYEMFCGKPCFEGKSSIELFDKILNSKWDWSKERIPSAEMQDFIKKCLSPNYINRPSTDEAMDHPWFHSVCKQQ